MDIQIGNLANLHYLWLVAAVVIVAIAAAVANRRAVAQFATANMASLLFPTAGRKRLLSLGLVSAALAMMALALVDIRWGKTWREVPQKGIEVMFVLDVSRSMLAEDVAPNRLERAKQQIKDMVDEMAGDRVGLVVFAGDVRQKIPLTTHYQDFKRTLDEVGPHDVNRGGSRLGDAISIASEAFLDKTSDHKAMVIITDGEDHQSDPLAVAEAVHQARGIRMFTIGLGDSDQGSRVPIQTSPRRRGYLTHQGEQIWSKMNGDVLKQIALKTDGAYIPAGTKQVDMASVYHQYVAQVNEQDFETAVINSYIPRYSWFVGLALMLLLAELFIEFPMTRPEVPSNPNNKDCQADSGDGEPSRFRAPWFKSAAAMLALAMFLPMQDVSADVNDFAKLINRGNAALTEGNVEQAMEDYQQATILDSDSSELKYNEAIALCRQGESAQARKLFSEATATRNISLEAKSRFNLANCDYTEALGLAEQDREAAIVKAKSAISHYRGALAVDPLDSDARVNIELANLLMQKLQKKQKQQEKDQQQQDQKQDQQQEKNQETNQNQDQQEDSSNESQQDKNQEQQQDSDSGSDSKEQESKDQQAESGESQNESEAKPQQNSGEQSEPSDEAQSQKDEKAAESEPEKQSPSNSDSRERSDPKYDQNSEEQSTDQTESDAGDEKQLPRQDKAASPAGGNQLAGEPSDSTTAVGLGEEKESEKGQAMTSQEAMKMLQAVRDRDLMRRMQNLRKAQRHYVPVDKDW